MLEALLDTCPVPARALETYSPEKELLVTYGTGHALRRPWWQQHRRRGERCLGLDLGYWDRSGDDAGMRFTIDTDHPPQFLRPEPAGRWDGRCVGLREDAGDGPVLLIGQGAKAVQVRGERPLQWEMTQLRRFKDRPLMFRPKRRGEPVPQGVAVSRHETIEEALQGVSLVVCRHSNVAVDACIAGVPVECEGGAAHALYRETPNPPPAERLAFLRSLAWWNWRPSEAAQAWKYMLERIECG
jgi:hypothetical protein